jgi:hypothetical protein
MGMGVKDLEDMHASAAAKTETLAVDRLFHFAASEAKAAEVASVFLRIKFFHRFSPKSEGRGRWPIDLFPKRCRPGGMPQVAETDLVKDLTVCLSLYHRAFQICGQRGKTRARGNGCKSNPRLFPQIPVGFRDLPPVFVPVFKLELNPFSRCFVAAEAAVESPTARQPPVPGAGR